MKLKEFLKGRGLLQHLVCFLLYCLEITMLLMLKEIFSDHTDLVIGGVTVVLFPITYWMLYLIFSDIAAIGRWLWRLILPEKLRGSMEKVMKKEVFRMGEDAIVKGIVDKEYYLRRNGQYVRISVKQARQLMDDWQKAAEQEIFRMWEDAVVWKDGRLQLRKNGEYTPITIEQARKQESGYHFYQMTQDIQRGGAPEDVARANRGFDRNGNFVGGYAVDEFMRKQQAAGVRSEAADDQPCAKICDLYQGELIWKSDGLYYQKDRGECTPVTREKAQELERLDWSYNADHICRMGASMEHVRLVEGFDENGNRTRTYAVDEFMKRRAEAVCTRCGAKHYAPLEDLIAPDFGCKSCGNPVKVRKVDKEFSPADIVVDGLIYRRIYAGMMLIGAEIGTKEAVVRSRVDSPVCIVEGVVLGCENDVPLVRIALREYDPGLKLTFEPGFRIDFRWDYYSRYMKQYGIGSMSNLPGFTRETVKNVAHYYNPDIVREVVHRSETQTIREKFENHGYDAVYTMELE